MMTTDDDLLDDLTSAQREAVTHFEGPLLILAGAGSGKTRVITRRIAWLIRQGVRPSSILAITFTNKAAGEMRSRVEQLIPNSRVWVSTFHSMGARLLRQYADRVDLDRNFTVYDQDDRAKITKMAIEAAGIDNVKFSPERVNSVISKAKNQLLTPDRFALKADDYFSQTVAKIYVQYQKRMREVNAVDFDDLLFLPALALKTDAELRAELDSRFRFVLIDEYQDTNQAQYEIARQLSTDQRNLCVVGDPDQSIYKWRGSDIRNILDFERDYDDTRVVTLDRNYRSTKAILAAADAVISHNKQRKPKRLTTENEDGAPVRSLIFDTGNDEADQIAARIRSANERNGRPYSDFAIFLRINALSRAIEAAFIQHRVPYQIVKGLSFFERKENRDVLAYLRLLCNPRDDLSFLRAIGEPTRGVGDTSLKHLRTFAEPRGLSLFDAATHIAEIPAIKGKAAKALVEFQKLIRKLQTRLDEPPDIVIRAVLEESGYRAMLTKSMDDADQERLANVEELISAAHQFADEDTSRTLGDFLENITLASDVDSWNDRQDCVSVMTLHSAKGLEFPVVYMIAVEQGLLPHERSLSQNEEVEEERRLCYVGMTRAKQELFLTHARLREFRGQSVYAVPSMFLDEIPRELLKEEDCCHHSGGGRAAYLSGRKPIWELDDPSRTATPPRDANGLEVGSLIDHLMYGRGKILEFSGAGVLRRVRIRFQYHGEKTFVVEKVKLTPIQADD